MGRGALEMELKENKTLRTKIFMYNNWHYGDLIFIKPLYQILKNSNFFDIKIGVYQNNRYLFEDLIDEFFDIILSSDDNETQNAQDLKELCPLNYICVNTWLGQYNDTHPHTWESTVKMFNYKMCEFNIPYQIDFDFEDVPMVPFPRIDINVEKNGIYVENGYTRSGHSNFEFDLELLADFFSECVFYCTSSPRILKTNLIDCSGKNIIELANISNKCIAILGKGSGPLLCTYTEENRYKPRAVCGYDLSKWSRFWTYAKNPLVYINSMREVVDFIENVLNPNYNDFATQKAKISELEQKIDEVVGNHHEMTCNSEKKKLLVKQISSLVNYYYKSKTQFRDDFLLSELRTKGIIKLPSLQLSLSQINDIHQYLKNIPVFSGHVPAQSDRLRRYLGKSSKKFRFGSYELEDSLLCPHILELALSPQVLAIAEQYLGCLPTIYSINTWWSFPGFSASVAQDYHRDVDDYKFLALFIYLTDVEGGNKGGQHQFVTHTHEEDQVVNILNGNSKLASELFIPKLKENGYNQKELYEKIFHQQIVDITGKAGSVFLADTYAFHKGMPPKKDPRLVCWIRYGLRKNLTYQNDETTPIPFQLIQKRITDSEKNRYLLRLLTSHENIKNPIYNLETPNGVKAHELVNFCWPKVSKKSSIQTLLEKIFRKKVEEIDSE